MASITSRTSFELSNGQTAIFELGGSGRVTVNGLPAGGQSYVIGNQEAFIGPFDRAVTLVVDVDNAPITYRIDSSGGDLKDQEPAIASLAARVKTGVPTDIPTMWFDGITTLGRGGYDVPSGLTSYADRFGVGGYEITGIKVTGEVGSTTLTIDSGTVADMGGTWAAAILCDDGIWRTHTIRNASGGTCTCHPPLEVRVTKGRMSNVQDIASGQHLSEPGSYALADCLIDANPGFSVRETYAGKIRETDTSGWSLYNALPGGNVTYNWGLNMHGIAANTAQLRGRLPQHTSVLLQNGKGVNKVFSNLAGRRGYIETMLSCSDATYPARVQILVDSRVVFDKDVFSFERIAVPFVGVTTAEVRITSNGTQTLETRIGPTTAWLTPGEMPDRMIPDGSRVVWLGDSWESRCASASIRRINQRLGSRGVVCTGVGSPGQTATWGISNFSKVADQAPSIVIVEYCINDFSELLVAGVDTWRARIATLIGLVKGIGAMPIVISSLPTGSQPQTQGLAGYSSAVAEGALAS